MNKRLLMLLMAATLFVGCKKSEEIQLHRIPKSRSNLDKFEDNLLMRSANRSSPSSAVPSRMVVGLIERESATWFLKVSGPVDQVNLTEPVWREFFATLQFGPDGNPKWEMPKGWSKGRESSMRFATLNMTDTNPPLEMSISSLGPNQNLLANANRWRGQLGLEPLQADELKLGKFPYDGGEMMLFDAVGMAAASGRGPMMGGGAPMVPSAPVTAPATVGFDAPEGWETGKTSSMVQVRLLKTQGEEQAQITVVEMPASVNEWEPNVKRWAGEVGMESINGPEMAVRTSKVDVDGVEGQQIKLIGEGPRGTIAVMVKRAASAWFLKLSGDKAVVESSENQFEQFVKSFKFEK